MKSPPGRGAVGDEDSWFGNDFFEVNAAITLVLANAKKIDGNMSVDGAVCSRHGHHGRASDR